VNKSQSLTAKNAELLHSQKSFLACQSMQSLVEVIAQFLSSMGEVAGTVVSQQAGRVVEYCQQVWSLSHAQLRMILTHRIDNAVRFQCQSGLCSTARGDGKQPERPANW
jgi:hypothetical protein